MLTEDKEDPFLSIQYRTHHLGNWIERDSVMRVGRLADDSLSRLFVFHLFASFFISVHVFHKKKLHTGTV